MPEGKRARPEGTKCPSAAFLPEAIFNYVLTVEEYAFALSEGKMPENCERDRKSAQNYANDNFEPVHRVHPSALKTQLFLLDAALN